MTDQRVHHRVHLEIAEISRSVTSLESAGGMVGAGRFERPTPCAQGRCATRLRYAPTLLLI